MIQLRSLAFVLLPALFMIYRGSNLAEIIAPKSVTKCALELSSIFTEGMVLQRAPSTHRVFGFSNCLEAAIFVTENCPESGLVQKTKVKAFRE